MRQLLVAIIKRAFEWFIKLQLEGFDAITVLVRVSTMITGDQPKYDPWLMLHKGSIEIKSLALFQWRDYRNFSKTLRVFL